MNPVRRTLVPALGAALLVAVAAPTASADYFPPGFPNGIPPKVAMLRNVNSGKCLEVADWRTDNGAPVRQWDCHGGASQVWNFVSGTPGTFVNVNSGKCLEVADWRRDNGAPVRQWDCHGGASQNWGWGRNSPTEGWKISNNFLKALEIGGWSTENGAPADQWDFHGGDNQRWQTIER
ncbi:RICIN domain-containing protein [Kitasatospora sp. NPDC086791]|uniref:RICIN domain-containing protein n=1 Tax=Kitasatospora sp. NPDC086791 TaxID=3155178 RepID=UPI00342F0425